MPNGHGLPTCCSVFSSVEPLDHRNQATTVNSLQSLCNDMRYPTFLTILRGCFANDGIVDGQNPWFNYSTTNIG